MQHSPPKSEMCEISKNGTINKITSILALKNNQLLSNRTDSTFVKVCFQWLEHFIMWLKSLCASYKSCVTMEKDQEIGAVEIAQP